MDNLSSASPFQLNGAINFLPRNKIGKRVETLIEQAFSLKRLNEVYCQFPSGCSDQDFLNKALEAFNINYHVSSENLERIPKTGPLVIVANHPFGAIEGIIMAAMLLQVRPDMKIMANYMLKRIPEISDLFIAVNPFGGAQAKQTNIRNFNELLGSEKEQAELNMIVDLERNDVAKICRPGTRAVIQARTIETYPTVFHAVATVAGRLRDEMTFCDVLKAMFPGGSITGAPKIRSMEIIDETEPTARGVYTGSIGFIGIDDSVCLNIAIRTIIIKGRKAYAQTGGGVVADSTPEAEWQETIIKARALLAGIIATQKIRRQIVEIKKKNKKSEVVETNYNNGKSFS